MSLLLASLGLAWSAALGEGDARTPPAPPPPPPPEKKTEFVEWTVEGKPLRGWPLHRTTEPGCIVLRDDGAFVLVTGDHPVPPDGPIQRPVAEIEPAWLATGLAHAEAGVRDRCEELLRDLGAKAVPALGEVLGSPMEQVRERALKLLARSPAPKLEARMRGLLNDPAERVRKEALSAWCALALDELLERCSERLEGDRSILVRHEAIVQLGRRADVRAVDPLLAHLEGCEDRSLTLVTFDALRRLTRRGFGRDEAKWRAWWTNHREEELALAEERRGRHGEPEATDR